MMMYMFIIMIKYQPSAFKYDAPKDPNYHLDIKFTKINDNQPGFWQKFKNMFL